ncbi:TIGR03790 family protein [Desulfobulbus alkaliphilus]|uniref:TIGR03790 family protein n=1 Tax=Desulfobulbus alkaliphilus TaxID=869814 RepID=UPI001963DF79|nr:TIGR03790 family protein [Desulfobulbus alkaliphilus]MBM9537659.1 TIGR03790 family protein [Desulfobulbus alkaliphilus]
MSWSASQKPIRSLLVLLLILLHPAVGRALAPEEVVVIANSRAKNSLALARYYMRQRQIPTSHLITIATTWDEHCSRQAYDREIRQPVRRALDRLGSEQRIRALVTVYGVPLAIRPPPPEEDGHLLELNLQLEILEEEQQQAEGERLGAIVAEKERLTEQRSRYQGMDTRAAVDSELALVLVDSYPLEGWLPNPFFLGFQHQQTLLSRDQVLIVSRLDGPDPETVRRLVDDAIHAEQQGLQGRACFDARWPRPKTQDLTGYAFYDASLHAAAEIVRQSGRMPVRLDATSDLFGPGDCPDTALYSGWYSLARYVDAFTWARGAVGYHIASSECATLKRPGSQVWCKRMLEEGVAATIGPVYEPYVQAFPPPDLFFSILTKGYLSLGETYLVTLPYLSWQMVLIGDPLYQPFAPAPLK